VDIDVSGNYTASSFRAEHLFNFTEEMRRHKQSAKQLKKLNVVNSAKREWMFLVPFSESYAINALLGCDSETS